MNCAWTRKKTGALLMIMACIVPSMAMAMSELDDEDLDQVTGSAMAFVWEDFRWLTKPTSFFEQMGTAADPATVWRRGDLRWYGLNTSATGAGTTWTESGGNMVACAGQGNGGLGCPRGGVIARFAAHDNPYILRVNDYPGDGSAASSIGNGIVSYPGVTSANQSVLELLAPTRQDAYRFSFWGELEVAKNPVTSTNLGLLKSQTIVQGNAAGSILRFWKFTRPGHETLAIQYHSRLQGDFRFSVGQTGTTSDAIGVPVVFQETEGMHFRNVNAFVPLGQLYYQALTLDVPRDGSGNPITNGNFVLDIPAIPNQQAVYTRFYSLHPNDATGYFTARYALMRSVGLGSAGVVPDNYLTTHGYSRWGNWFPCQGGTGAVTGVTAVNCANPPTTIPAGRNAYNFTGDGIFFQKCATCGNFLAMSYRYTRVDVRPGQTQYDAVQRMATYSACTPTTGSPWQCGYGGATGASGAALSAANCSITNQPNQMGLCTGGTAVQNKMDPVRYGAANQTIPMVSTPVANLGDARMEGLLLNSLRFTSFGAQY